MAINSVVILTKLVPMVLMYLLVSTAPYAEGFVSCGSVASKVVPCINYMSKGSPMQVPCCDAVKALNAGARTTPDRQATCGCLKNIIRGLPGINLGRLASLPATCGVSLPYKITPSIDCTTVKY